MVYLAKGQVSPQVKAGAISLQTGMRDLQEAMRAKGYPVPTPLGTQTHLLGKAGGAAQTPKATGGDVAGGGCEAQGQQAGGEAGHNAQGGCQTQQPAGTGAQAPQGAATTAQQPEATYLVKGDASPDAGEQSWRSGWQDWSSGNANSSAWPSSDWQAGWNWGSGWQGWTESSQSQQPILAKGWQSASSTEPEWQQPWSGWHGRRDWSGWEDRRHNDLGKGAPDNAGKAAGLGKGPTNSDYGPEPPPLRANNDHGKGAPNVGGKDAGLGKGPSNSDAGNEREDPQNMGDGRRLRGRGKSLFARAIRSMSKEPRSRDDKMKNGAC